MTSPLTERYCETGCNEYTPHLRTQFGALATTWTCLECADRAMRMEYERLQQALKAAAKSVGTCPQCGTIIERELCPRCELADAFGVSA